MEDDNFKAPQFLIKDICYHKWKKEPAICLAFTNINKKKQASAIFLTLRYQAKEEVTKLLKENLTNDSGFNPLMLGGNKKVTHTC